MERRRVKILPIRCEVKVIALLNFVMPPILRKGLRIGCAMAATAKSNDLWADFGQLGRSQIHLGRYHFLRATTEKAQDDAYEPG